MDEKLKKGSCAVALYNKTSGNKLMDPQSSWVECAV